MFKIAIDAGHDANTAGKRCHKSLDPNETREWWLNDRVCDHIERILKAYRGYEVLRLDDSDDGMTPIHIEDRVKMANDWGANLYLSVHHNAAGFVFNGGGIVAYSHPKAGKTTVEWRDALYDALIARTDLKGNRSTPKAESNLLVLRETKMPAVLLELGFMDSKTDVPIILTDRFAENCARAIVEVVARRGKLTSKSKDPLYVVQVGAFGKKSNAEKLVEELKAKGFKPYIKKA